MTTIGISEGSKSSVSEQLMIFFAKVAIGSVTFCVVTYFGLQIAIWSITSTIEDKYPIVRGGASFWRQAEVSLTSLANEPDMDEAKKKRIAESLRKISKRYRPFIEAISASDDPK